MRLKNTYIQGVYLIEANQFKDHRGFFARTYCKNEFLKIGIQKEFMQFNQSFNSVKGTVRGMHYQIPPYTEIKYVRCVQGSIYDVVVDVRKNSPTFLQHFSIELSFSNMLGLIVPHGCAHGFQVLENNTSVLYFHTEVYQQGFERGVRFDDPLLKINWPLEVSLVSERDKNFPLIDNNFEPIQL